MKKTGPQEKEVKKDSNSLLWIFFGLVLGLVFGMTIFLVLQKIHRPASHDPRVARVRDLINKADELLARLR
ncbi:MAG: hypothetical protein J7M18_08655 [Candidatus Eremiobacteraeota bacterium]|nr:hypothetical protein [Candidatus Eremiobacteraeota bacterium]